jgi:DNA-directed RNA polymerase I and III subunit RPAC1
VYRYEDLKDSVVLEKIKDHYIFTVESVGAIKPHELVSTLAPKGKRDCLTRWIWLLMACDLQE